MGGGLSMCGILGLISYKENPLTALEKRMIKKAINDLFTFSEARGRDASGIAMLTDKQMFLFKDDVPASKFVLMSSYKDIMWELNNPANKFKAIIGHTRLKTKGTQKFNVNNHPIRAGRIVGVHNGFIINDDALFEKYKSEITREGLVDSEIIFKLINMYREKNKSLIESTVKTVNELYGSCACAFLDTEAPDYLILYTTNSSFSNLHVYVYNYAKVIVFASTELILHKALSNNMTLSPQMSSHKIELAGTGMRIDLRTGERANFSAESLMAKLVA